MANRETIVPDIAFYKRTSGHKGLKSLRSTLLCLPLAPKTLDEDVLTSDDARMVCLNISWIGEKGIAGMEPCMKECQSPSEPDWAKIDAMQASIEMTALVMGELEVVSDTDREMIGSSGRYGCQNREKG